jgi:predicted phosphodiesterase
MTQTESNLGFWERRAFCRQGVLWMASGAGVSSLLASGPGAEDVDSAKPAVRLGLLADIHYADLPAAINRYYRDSLAKVRAVVERFNAAKLDGLVFLGDLVDTGPDVKTEIGFVKTIDAELRKFKGDRHYVLGNHCIWSLTKQEFADATGAKTKPYSFDLGGFHFVILDACFRKDGVAYGRKNNDWKDTDIPKEQQEWLAADLAATGKKTIVFVHQRLDVEGAYGVHQQKTVRKILEDSKKVLAVFMGHSHKNEYRQIAGIHYCVLRAVVEGPGDEKGEKNNAAATMEVFKDGTLKVTGFGEQIDYAWKHEVMR